MSAVVPVIMCGGAGTRLWPASRHARPKQFLELIGDRSLFQEAVLRIADPDLFARPICITNTEYRFVVAEQLRSLDIDAEIVLEPARRDSAPAFCAACMLAESEVPGAAVLALPADHLIADVVKFRDTVRRGLDAVAQGYIVTFGARPDHPATGYGYIAPSTRELAGGAIAVDAFVEKPDEAQAEEYIAQGYFWNTGNFLTGAATLVGELERHAPEIPRAVRKAVDTAVRDLDFLRLDETAFAASAAISIDYAVMEKTERAAVIEAEFDWSDIGSWSSVWSHSQRDASGNAVHGDVVIEDGRNNFAHSDGGLVTLVGVDDLVVVATRDAVMVAPRDGAESIKALVAKLESGDRKEVVDHPKVFRPWGSYETVDAGSGYQVKRITVSPGAKLSLQRHKHRSEHWVVVHGTARVTIDDMHKDIGVNQSVYIPVGGVHRLANPGESPLELIEVQCGDYLGEDDIERFDDIYGRDTGA